MPQVKVSRAPAPAGRPVDLPELPGAGNRPQILLGGLVLAIGAIWIVVPLLPLVIGARPPLPDLGDAGIGVLVAVGAGQVLWGLDLLLRRETLIIDQNTLHVAIRGLWARRRWSEPLANYRGLRHRRDRIRHRYGWRIEHRLQLAHPDPTKEIELARTWSERRIEAARHQWAAQMNLPVWSADGAAPPRPVPDSDRRAVEAKGAATS